MASTTQVGAVQDALKTLLDGIAALSEFTISLGEPKRKDRDSLWIPGGVLEWNRIIDTTGPTAAGGCVEESFIVHIQAVVVRRTGDFTDVRDVMLAAVAAIEGAIAAANVQGQPLGDLCRQVEIRASRMWEGFDQDNPDRWLGWQGEVACVVDLTQ